MKKKLAAAVIAFTMQFAGAGVAGIEPFLGEVQTFAFRFCPRGFLAMNGQLLSISQNTALFSLLGTTYGGNGVTTFALPTAKPVLLADGKWLVQCIAIQGIYPSTE